MVISDYLIDQSGKNWSELLSGWSDILPTVFTLWFVNRFGDVFAIFEDDSVHMLDVGIGMLKRVADNRDHFAVELDVGDNANSWLMIPLVDRCVAAGITLGRDQCYGFKIPPVLGGGYGLENAVPTDLSMHYSFLADIYGQTKDVPDGAQIEIVIGERPSN